MNELTIAENKEEEFFPLEELITEGANAKVPIVIEFPGGKKAQALIKPITTGEFSTIYNQDPAELLVNVLNAGLMNKNGEPLPAGLIESLPVGLPAKIVQKIFDISGIRSDPEDVEQLRGELELFP